MKKNVEHKRSATLKMSGVISIVDLVTYDGFRVDVQINSQSNTQVARYSTDDVDSVITLGEEELIDTSLVIPVSILILDTTKWPTGSLSTDILLYNPNGERAASETFCFKIEKEETPPNV